jgi:hypothetical protein
LVTLIPFEQEFITITRQMNENVLFIAVACNSCYWILVTRRWTLVTPWWILNAGDLILNSEYSFLTSDF